MKYQKPEMEIVLLNGSDIVRTSNLTGEGGGSGNEYGGDGTQPWE